jgi:uncharacterized protein YacL
MAGSCFALLIVLVWAIGGGLIGHRMSTWPLGLAVGFSSGALLGFICVQGLKSLVRTDVVRVLGGIVGTLLGSLIGIGVGHPVSHVVPNPEVANILYGFLVIVTSLVGMQLGAAKISELRQTLSEGSAQGKRKVLGILDTSVIIDGRIADVCETGFLMGDLIIPEFILKELQAIADSSESTKRTRGRRGLDILHKIQKQSYIAIIISSTDYPAVKEVDQKLIHMARETGYSILTNDFNLNKVAEVHSIQVLNMNQLANALKPVVLPGETIRVQVMKEGKEYGQGVAYLDDGTMVVVDSGRHHMGKTVEVVVTSVLQTTAGKMIFGVLKT